MSIALTKRDAYFYKCLLDSENYKAYPNFRDFFDMMREDTVDMHTFLGHLCTESNLRIFRDGSALMTVPSNILKTDYPHFLSWIVEEDEVNNYVNYINQMIYWDCAENPRALTIAEKEQEFFKTCKDVFVTPSCCDTVNFYKDGKEVFVYSFIDGSFLRREVSISNWQEKFKSTTGKVLDAVVTELGNLSNQGAKKFKYRLMENYLYQYQDYYHDKGGEVDEFDISDSLQQHLVNYFDKDWNPLRELYIEKQKNGKTTYWIDCKDSVLEIRDVDNLKSFKQFVIRKHTAWKMFESLTNRRESVVEYNSRFPHC